MEKHKTFSSYEEALDCQEKRPGSEITHKAGHPIMIGGEMMYDIPENAPSWTVWWEE